MMSLSLCFTVTYVVVVTLIYLSIYLLIYPTLLIIIKHSKA